MGIESTKTLTRYEAICRLAYKGIDVPCYYTNETISDLLYDNRDSIFENYEVVNDEKINEDEL